MTALMIASKDGELSLVTALLAAGADDKVGRMHAEKHACTQKLHARIQKCMHAHMKRPHACLLMLVSSVWLHLDCTRHLTPATIPGSKL